MQSTSAEMDGGHNETEALAPVDTQSSKPTPKGNRVWMVALILAKLQRNYQHKQRAQSASTRRSMHEVKVLEKEWEQDEEEMVLCASKYDESHDGDHVM
jgi:hypothetical protein